MARRKSETKYPRARLFGDSFEKDVQGVIGFSCVNGGKGKLLTNCKSTRNVGLKKHWEKILDTSISELRK